MATNEFVNPPTAILNPPTVIFNFKVPFKFDLEKRVMPEKMLVGKEAIQNYLLEKDKFLMLRPIEKMLINSGYVFKKRFFHREIFKYKFGPNSPQAQSTGFRNLLCTYGSFLDIFCARLKGEPIPVYPCDVLIEGLRKIKAFMRVHVDYLKKYWFPRMLKDGLLFTINGRYFAFESQLKAAILKYSFLLQNPTEP